MSALLGRDDLDDDGVQALRAVIRGSGAVDRVEDLISDRAAEARSALARAEHAARLDGTALDVLDTLISVSTARAA
jgi:geranylgeranyl diphosphate synthase type I